MAEGSCSGLQSRLRRFDSGFSLHKIMKVGIIGYGFVGKALANSLKKNVQLIKIDPKLDTKTEDLNKFNPDIIFICIPTPFSHNSDFQDISILSEVIDDILKLSVNPLIVLKSTVLPNHLLNIQKNIPNIVYNPEFLREKSANEDFINSKLILFGGEKPYLDLLANFYDSFTRCINKEYQYTDLISASLVKYSINSFLATKVIFFNELKSLFDISTDEDWQNFIDILSKDDRLGCSHMNVPGHDGRLGFGGACLPKDSIALLNFAKSKDVDLNLIKNTIKTNNIIRAQYNTPVDREQMQKINFDDK